MATILATLLLPGTLHREPRGIANIGFESFLVLIFYSLTFLALSRAS